MDPVSALSRWLTIAAWALGCWGCPSVPRVAEAEPSPSALDAVQQASLCALGHRYGPPDLLPAGESGLALRVVTAERQLKAELAARWPAGRAPAGFRLLLVEEPRPRIAIVIDDLGLHPNQLDDLWALGQPLTYAILPGQRWSRQYALWLGERGASVLVHLPMEPREGELMTIGGYLTRAQSPADRRRLVRQHLASVPGAVGFNNHMGSLLTAHPAIMREIVGHFPRDSLVLDSRTTASSRLADAARATHPTAERTEFLDHERSVGAITRRLEAILVVAERDGSAVAIGHPYRETVAALEGFLESHGQRFHVVPLERLVQPSARPRWARSCPPNRRRVSALSATWE